MSGQEFRFRMSFNLTLIVWGTSFWSFSIFHPQENSYPAGDILELCRLLLLKRNDHRLSVINCLSICSSVWHKPISTKSDCVNPLFLWNRHSRKSGHKNSLINWWPAYMDIYNIEEDEATSDNGNNVSILSEIAFRLKLMQKIDSSGIKVQ